MQSNQAFLNEIEYQMLTGLCTQLGARGVRLEKNGQLLAEHPPGSHFVPPARVVCSTDGTLELYLYGVECESWEPAAQACIELLGHSAQLENDLEELTAALVETQDRLVALYEFTASTRHAVLIPDLLHLLMAEACRLLLAEGAFTVVYLPGQPVMICEFGDLCVSETDLHALALQFRNDTHHHAFHPNEPMPECMGHITMAILPVREEVFACVGVLKQNAPFTAPDNKLLTAISNQAGAKLDKTLLYQESLEKARYDTELDLAREVQTALLPQSLPALDGLDICGASIPARQVGGDFFDVVPISANRLIVLLGDVTGKGMPAAMLMTMTLKVARSAAKHMPFQFPHQLAARLNSDLIDDFTNVGMFATAFLGMIDRPANRLYYTNAGQALVILLRHSQEPIFLEPTDMPIGIFDGHAYTTESVDFKSGDLLCVMSDGFNETRNGMGEMFGYDRMKSLVNELSNLPAKEIVDGIFQRVNDFSGSQPQHDDQTIIVLKNNEQKMLKGDGQTCEKP